jgi:hypothetical protein
MEGIVPYKMISRVGEGLGIFFSNVTVYVGSLFVTANSINLPALYVILSRDVGHIMYSVVTN